VSLAAYLGWRTAAQRYGCRPWQLTPEQQAEVDAQVTRELWVIEAALSATEAAGVEADADVVQSAMNALAQGNADESFHGDLLRAGLDGAKLAQAIGEELRAGLVLEQVGARAVVDEAEVRAWYERQRARMALPERRIARHILITVNDDFQDNSRARAQQRLGQAADALAAGADFAELALRHSECPSALDGGSLGEVRRGQLYPELEAVLFALNPDEVRAVESPLGYHLLRCDAIIPEQPLSYEAAAPAIRRRLEATARERHLRAWLARRSAA